jgi:uncharacterized membrane protein YdbT with pleckstrin-like domain
MFLLGLMLFLPVGLYWILARNTDILTGSVSRPLSILFAGIYYLFVFLYFYAYFIDFYLDMLIITNDRLIDVEQKGVFSRSIAEVDLYQIQDASSEIKGAFSTLFNYGDIQIQTAGALPKFVIHNISSPHVLRQEILALAAEDKKYHIGIK